LLDHLTEGSQRQRTDPSQSDDFQTGLFFQFHVRILTKQQTGWHGCLWLMKL
jgi:hypothetical protein